MNRKEIIWKHLVPFTIFLVVFCGETCIQFWILGMDRSYVSFAVKLMLGFFVSDIITATWIMPSKIKNPPEDNYSFNSIVSSWVREHINIKFIHIVLIGLAYFLVISCIIWLSGGGNALPNVQEGRDAGLAFAIGLIVAPIVETLFNQFAVIEVVRLLTKRLAGYDYYVFGGIVSAVIFSLMHNYSAIYVVYAAFLGLFLSFTYLYTSNRYASKLKGILCTSIVHFLFNLLPFLSMVFGPR